MNIYKTLVRVVLNWIFPNEPYVEELCTLRPEDFFTRAPHAVDQPYPYIYSMFSYHHPLVEKAIWELKYRGNRQIALLFATMLYDYMKEILAEDILFSNFSSPLLIPIPLSKERLRERGWNQSEMLARELARLDNNNFFTLNTRLLKKIRHTKPQTTLKKRERFLNLKDCFSINEQKNNQRTVYNRNIILIDDVTTTGSTLEEAARALKLAGARRILAFTIAH